MALGRKFLKAIGLTDEQVESVIEAHTETITGIKEELKTAKDVELQYNNLKKEYDDFKNTHSSSENYKEKYENEHAAFENFKSEIVAKEKKAAKETAVKNYFESKNIVGKGLAIAMRGSKSEIEDIEIDEKGNIKNVEILDNLINGDFSGLISNHETIGTETVTPPLKAGKDSKFEGRAKKIAEEYFLNKYGVEKQKNKKE